MREDGPVSDVVTGEAVALDLRIAQLPSRLTAAVLDLLLMVAAYGGLTAAVLYAGLSDADPALTAAVSLSLLVLIFLGYPVAMETLTRGRTLGKMVLGLKVVRDDGSSIRFRPALVRTLMWFFVDFAPWFAACPGIVASFTAVDPGAFATRQTEPGGSPVTTDHWEK